LQLDTPRRQHRPISFGIRVRIAREAASGIAFLHERGFVHRDVKAANVLLTADRHAKVTDFGISKHNELVGKLPQAEFSNTAFVGTLHNMAPEVMRAATDCSDEDLLAGSAPQTGTIETRNAFLDGNGRQHSACYGAPSDVYSFSMMLFEIVYRQHVWPELNPMQFLLNVCLKQLRPSLPPPNSRSSPANMNMSLVIEILISSCWQHT